jgi:formamidopyrimidine-DNA glycosylase
LTPKEINALTKIIPQILAAAIAARGTTFDGKYVDSRGQSGNYVEKLQVYGRANLPCYRCGELLVNQKIGGRSSIFCERCQK